jgi:type IV pilus assembly protein PilE
MKYAKGFTLIEILLVVALIGILAAIAIPSYNDYIIRGKLVDATTQLSDARIKLEQHFQDYKAYDYSNPAGVPPVVSPCPAATKYFTFACAPTPTAYTVTASSNANQGLGAAGDYSYTINESNAKTTAKFAGTVLAPATCWLMKKGDSC